MLKVDRKAKTIALMDVADGGRAARALWSRPLPQKAPPVEAYVTDDGRYVVLRDVWHRVGYGKVLVFLGSGGRLLASYPLDGLLTQDEILDAKHTASSLWWSEHGLFFFTADQQHFAFVTQRGTLRVFRLASGQPLPPSSAPYAEARERAIQLARKALHSSSDADRSAGAIIAGILGDQHSAVALRLLLEDKEVTSRTGRGKDGGLAKQFGVRLAAGRGLVSLLGRGAAPVLAQRLPGANPHMTRQWLRLLGESGGAGSSSVVARYSRDPDPTIRREAVRAMLAGDDGTVMRQNPQWITDEEDSVRYEVLVVLADHGTATQAPLLRRALEDDSTLNVGWALRGLIRLNPTDLDTVLRKLLSHPAERIQSYATIELGRRGDAASLKKLVRWLVEWIDRPIRFIDRTPLEVLVQRQPPGARQALRTVWTRLGQKTPVNVIGALAAMGDSAALAALRKQAAAGDPLRRAGAIDWLGTCRDRASGPKLAEWLVDPEPSVREAATEAHIGMTGSPAPKIPATAVAAFVPAPPATTAPLETPWEPRGGTPVERRPPDSEFPWPVMALLLLFGAAAALARRQQHRRTR